MTKRFMDQPIAEANARRIVAAINACAGIATEELEALSDGELAAALTAFIDREVAQMRRGTAELLRRLSQGESPC